MSKNIRFHPFIVQKSCFTVIWSVDSCCAVATLQACDELSCHSEGGGGEFKPAPSVHLDCGSVNKQNTDKPQWNVYCLLFYLRYLDNQMVSHLCLLNVLFFVFYSLLPLLNRSWRHTLSLLTNKPPGDNMGKRQVRLPVSGNVKDRSESNLLRLCSKAFRWQLAGK